MKSHCLVKSPTLVVAQLVLLAALSACLETTVAHSPGSLGDSAPADFTEVTIASPASAAKIASVSYNIRGACDPTGGKVELLISAQARLPKQMRSII